MSNSYGLEIYIVDIFNKKKKNTQFSLPLDSR